MCANSMTYSPTRLPEPTEPQAEITHTLLYLVSLLRQQEESGILPHSLDANGDVIFDVEMEGFRCLILQPRPNLCEKVMGLSGREKEIALLVAKGHPNKTIASLLEISEWTVGTYLRRIFAKLGVNSRAAMVAKVSTEFAINPSTGLPSLFS